MRAIPLRFVRSGMVLLIASFCFSPLGQVFAQETQVSGVDGSTYSSPTFGYTLTWDDTVWGVADEFTEAGYDSLTLESATSTLYIESIYFYQGNTEECLSGERLGVAEESGLADLDPLSNNSGEPIELFEDGVSLGSETQIDLASGEADSYDWVVYLQCRTLIPNAVVMVITGFVDPADLDAQLATIVAVTDSIEADAIEAPAFNEADLERIVQLSGVDVDSYWDRVFDENGESFVNPKFITFGETIETGCGDAVPEDAGPFYCPADQTVYLDFPMMSGEMLPFGVIVVQIMLAHEIAHHVQELLGLTGCSDPACGVDGSSLAIELQADCLAGSWMQDAAARDFVSDQDLKRVEVGIKSYFGDPAGTSRDDPDAHGSGETRFDLFMAGYTNGIAACANG